MMNEYAVPKVFLADDHPIIRYGVRMALEAQGAAKVIGEAGSANELLELLRQSRCDIIVTDFSMPDDQGRDGLSLIERLRRLYPDIPVVVITALRNAGLLASLMRQGVAGLVEKEGDVGELGLALQAASKGREFVSRNLRTLLLENEVAMKGKDTPKLTDAEIEVLRLFAYDGLTSQQISERLNRSRKTISRHKRSAQAKLGLNTNQELLDYCRQVDLKG
ncbi:response regulator transcription factor [Luteibacter jiangsuensis]|uniref:Response regulator transcription factor n=1 Tax=Luteibacter jiangsuensis TaxID=637577 RepID=A0ABX0Q407_9GAMM|nr:MULTISPECIES: response regulator transcription factor [Luteibacter]NID04700.1 response regulator transcription factor [Luteibacter jiangsuensis]NII55598.1 two-component system capsular synthesis response regulator RcsB [Luteibacter sp. SG786]